MVHIPRKRVLADALTSLSPEQRERLMRSEAALIAFLDRQLPGGEGRCRGSHS
ncbi:hypothetical protein [Streptomyces griseorubiginosus]|uniref:hypothetical protein n=1 Tax=Streptomyces griseorubiginosus TaxID=67304 RepID=UPI0033E66F62